MAKELGFDSITTNSMDAVSDRDYVIELSSAASILMMHFSRLSEEIILWNSQEFGFVKLTDQFVTGSSMMPQKKNPDFAELARGKTGRVFGNLFRILTILKGLPLTYNRDLQEDKEGFFDTIDTVLSTLDVFAGMIPAMEINVQNMNALSESSEMLATDLADMILEAERDDGTIRYGVLDSSLWHRRGDTGPSLAEQMIMKGCRWRPSDRSKGSRIAGKNEIHRRLQIDEFTEAPRLVFFNNCTNIISQLPIIPLDKNNSEDVDTNSEDHLYDALRYGVMTRPRSSLFDYNPETQRTGFQAADATFGY